MELTPCYSMNLVLQVEVDQRNQGGEERDRQDSTESFRTGIWSRKGSVKNHVRQIEDDVEHHEYIVNVSMI